LRSQQSPAASRRSAFITLLVGVRGKAAIAWK
jgi:hypothetical protein